MSQDDNIKSDEIAQADVSVGGGGVVMSTHSGPISDASQLVHRQKASRDVSDIEKSPSSGAESQDLEANGEPKEEVEEQDADGDHNANDLADLEAITTTRSRVPYSNFTLKQKRFIVAMAAWGGFFSAVSANIYFPALNSLSADFHVSSTLINLTLTTYTIFQGLAPTVVGDLADMVGRRPAYVLCFVIYIGANIGLALCNNYASLLVLRCLQSTGSSGTIALGSGVVADISTSSERGTWMGWNTAGPMIAPALGPVLGGILAQFLGWRSIFWFLVILSAVYLITLLSVFPETGRNVVGNGSIPPQRWNVSLINYLAARKAQKSPPPLNRTVSRASQREEQQLLAQNRKLRWPNPLHTLKILLEKDVAMLLFYNSIIYIAFYDLTASNPYLFAQVYGFNDLQIGLCFIPYGCGALLAPIINGRMLDWNFRRHARKAGITIDKKRALDTRDFPLEKSRIEIAIPLIILGDAAYLCYGWVMQVNAPLAAPLVLQFIIGLSITGSFNCLNVLLIDLYPLSPATVTAANNLVRCEMGAWGAAAIVPMIDGMGRGWAFTLIAALVALFLPILLVLEKKGPAWREARRAKMERSKLDKEAAIDREEHESAERSVAQQTSEKASLHRQLSHGG